MTTPNPGSTEAQKLGCCCAVIDNHHGAGFKMKGRTQFWITESCKIHGKKKGKTR